MDWTQMQPELFDTSAKPVQEALFAAPDKCGTPDLFDSIEIPAAPADCPRCPAIRLGAYAERHAAIHARQDRNYAEAVAADKAITAAVGPTDYQRKRAADAWARRIVADAMTDATRRVNASR